VRGDLPTGTVTFLFTDIEGSTRLLHALGGEAYGDALAEHRRLLRDAFTAHGGVEVDTQGDAFFVAFPTAEGAAAAALDAQETLTDGPISVRMGLHTGTPMVGGEGYVGVDVHRGARVAALAHGGQVVVSPSTAALLDGYRQHDLGLHRLKDFDGAIRLSQLGEREFPPLRTPGGVDLPTPATRFIGREQELFDAVSLVYERDPRVLTIVGPGGTGKTRFAIELARLLADEAEGATVFVPLASIRDSTLVLETIADQLGAATSEPASIAGALRDRRTHLVLDNLEHLLPGSARPIAELVEAAPALRIFATSREPLRIRGEAELDLPPLVDDEAAALFVERARAVRPDVDRSDAVAELCRQLDHLPLALELAAARTKLLSPTQLLERLEKRLDLPGTRDADERHATLRATIAWSYDLLEPREQDLFGQLSVFRTGATLESAEAVCGADVETLASLLDKSLVRRRTGRLDEERYWMLETIRQFAAEQLEATGDAETVRRRHAERMLEIAREAHLTAETGMARSLPQRHELVHAERDDMRAALDWAAEHDRVLAVELIVALENFWASYAPDEGRDRLAAIFPGSEPLPDALHAAALRARGSTTYRSGDYDEGVRWYQRSLDAFRELGDEVGEAIVLTRLAVHAANVADAHASRQLGSRCLELSRRLELPWVEAQALDTLATAHQLEGDLDNAVALAEQSAALSAETGFRWWEAASQGHLIALYRELGDLDAAEQAGRRAVRVAVAIQDRRTSLWCLASLALVAREKGEPARARRLWNAVAAEHARDPVFGPPSPFWELTAPLGEPGKPEADLEDVVEELLAERAQTEP
jgi:predicted ATPase/class 3 adenylate cyclase